MHSSPWAPSTRRRLFDDNGTASMRNRASNASISRLAERIDQLQRAWSSLGGSHVERLFAANAAHALYASMLLVVSAAPAASQGLLQAEQRGCRGRPFSSRQSEIPEQNEI